MLSGEAPVVSPPEAAAVPEAMLRVQKCPSCGFPISEGRTLCLDCELKDIARKTREKEQGEIAQRRAGAGDAVRLGGSDGGGIRAGLPGKLSSSKGIVAGEPRQSVGDRRGDPGHTGRGGGVSITTFAPGEGLFPLTDCGETHTLRLISCSNTGGKHEKCVRGFAAKGT